MLSAHHELAIQNSFAKTALKGYALRNFCYVKTNSPKMCLTCSCRGPYMSHPTPSHKIPPKIKSIIKKHNKTKTKIFQVQKELSKPFHSLPPVTSTSS